MSYISLMKQINKGNIEPIYLLYGTESYFIEKVSENIVKKLKSDIGDELTTYDLESTSIQEVIADAETIPFFNEKKLIIAHNPTFLLARQSRLPFEHNLSTLESYLKNPPQYTTLVFIAPFEKLDNRKKITKLLNKHASILQSEPIKQYEVGKWIDEIGSEYRITFTKEAKQIIESDLSPNLLILHNEIEKMAHFVGENGEVTKEIVIDLISSNSEISALQLVDAVMERNLYKAITIYKMLEKMNEEPIAMIALLAYQFRVIFQVKLLKEKGYPDQEVVRSLKVHPYVAKLATQRGRHFSIKRLEQILNRFAETDHLIKRGKMEKEIAFEMLLYDLIEK